ncbi:MAG: ParB/RepB/Spo0J family partition protein [Ruminococcus sp.]|nr:ParB/RepB/Spo0J family partition protein [Ruminococcus sp.]
MFKNIEISKLQPHPQNPRKNVGDISELAASIKKNGVFQNLTVVPNGDDTYTIIIGHRRHAAAQEAGLTELPCAVVEMTDKEQLSTMLLENMQREDLTVLEQAEGFQMMIDLGESVKSISEQTGFSQSTVRHRVELLKLDRDTLEKQGREIPITAYIKLEQIKDIDRRNKVLKEIGTNNFDWALKRAIGDEKREHDKKEWLQRLEDMKLIDISELSYSERWEKYKGLGTCYYSDSVETAMKLIPDDAGQVYYTTEYSWFGLFVEKPDVKEEPDDEETLARKKAEQERQEKQTILETIEEMCRENVLEFCHNFKSKNPSDIQRIFQLFILLVVDRNHNYDAINVRSVLNENEFKTLENGGALSDVPVFKDVPAALLTLAVESYARFECYDWNNQYEEDTDLLAIYECIQELGYEASDEELEYINGTHELYSKSEE